MDYIVKKHIGLNLFPLQFSGVKTYWKIDRNVDKRHKNRFKMLENLYLRLQGDIRKF